MILEIHIPIYPLNQFIENFVYFKDHNPSHFIERFLPDGCNYVVFNLTESPKFIYDNETLQEIQSFKNVWVSGIRNSYITIPSAKDSEMFVINFRKGKAYPFINMPMNQLTDFVVDAELAMPKEILSMRQVLLDAITPQQKFICAEQYLLKIFRNKLTINPFIEYSTNLILQSPRQLTISYISNKVGFSQKHFIKIFKEHVGIIPKTFLKITRFQKAIQEIEAKKQKSWSSLAYECGYYDQAHFIHDFKQFSGYTPSQLINQKSDFTNYIAIE